MYSRFKALERYGDGELRKLEDSTAAVIGLGATGSVIAGHLARHGVNLILVDHDYLEENDLYSSNLYTREQVEKGLPKARAAEQELEELTGVKSHSESLRPGNVSVLDEADVILDGTDNLGTRFLINEYAKREGTPWIYTAALGEEGYSMFFRERCFSCVFEEAAPGALGTCRSDGIMRTVASRAASRSASKAVRFLAGKEVPETLDAVHSGESLDVEHPGCEVCRGGNFPRLDSGEFTTPVCGEEKYMIETEVTDEAFERLRGAGTVLADNDYLTRVEINGRSLALYRSGRAIIEARDRGHARSRVAEVLGI